MIKILVISIKVEDLLLAAHAAANVLFDAKVSDRFADGAIW